MTNANRPGLPVTVCPGQVKVAAGVDGEVTQRRQFARGEIDREPLRYRSEVQEQRPAQRDRLRILVDGHIAEAHAFRRIDEGGDALAGSVLAVEAAALKRGAD